MNFSILRRSFSLQPSKTQIKPDQDSDTDETSFSVLRGEKVSINKILSRESSAGHSSRIYYRSTTNLGVPFQWEKKPGTPMNLPREEVTPPSPPPLPPPPLAPPPPVQSLVLAQPNILAKHSSLSWRFWLWRMRIKKNMRMKMYGQRGYHKRFSSSNGDLDDEVTGWSYHDTKPSSCSTSSSLTSLSNDQFDSFRYGAPSCCTWRKYRPKDN